MSSLVYNGVELSFLRTPDVAADKVYDPSGTDLLYVKYTVAVEAVLTPGVAPCGANETPGDCYARIRHMLATPRKGFTYTAGGGVVLTVADGHLDAANGPIPEAPEIVLVTDQALTIRWAVTACIAECDEVSRAQWLSIRWTQEQDVDEANYSVITTKGRLVGNADVLRGKIDNLRGLVVPPLPDNFVRKSHYDIAESGLDLEFTFVDTEQYIMPPPDAVKIEGKCRHFFFKNGGVWRAHIHLKLTGRKDTPKPRNMATAISIAMTRLRKAGVDKKNGKLAINEGAFEEDLASNTVTVDILAQCMPPNGVSGGDGKGLIYAIGAGIGQTVLPPIVQPAVGVLMIADALQAKKQQEEADRAAKAAKLAGNVLPFGLDQWGSHLPGCGDPGEANPGIGPDLYGALPNFRLLAAALNDPCLRDTLKAQRLTQKQMLLEQTGEPEKVTVKGRVPSPPEPDTARPRLNVETRDPAAQLSRIVVLNQLPPWRGFAADTYSDPHPGLYETYEISSRYIVNNNQDVCEVTDDAAEENRLIRWAKPGLTLDVTWTATKYGVPPAIPDPEPVDDNAVLLTYNHDLADKKTAADGVTSVYTITGAMRYKFKRPKEVRREWPAAPFLGSQARLFLNPPTAEHTHFGQQDQAQAAGRLTNVPGAPPVNA